MICSKRFDDGVFRGTVYIKCAIMGNVFENACFNKMTYFNGIHCISWPHKLIQRASDTAFSNGYIKNLPYFLYMDRLQTRYPTHFI